MADKITSRNAADASLRDIMTESAVIAEYLGKEPPVFTQRNRDPDYLRMVQLKEVAAWLKDVSEAVAPKKKEKATK